MIRWYDFFAAFLIADLMMTFFFTIPVFGAMVAWIVYEFGWGAYCNYRLEMESD